MSDFDFERETCEWNYFDVDGVSTYSEELCGKPAVEYVLVSTVENHKVWFCAEHWDIWEWYRLKKLNEAQRRTDSSG